MNGIFINYRRDDSMPYAGRLYDFLRRSFPDKKIFMDIDAIDPGEDFEDAINKTLDSSRVVLAVIGRSWLNSADENGQRRLDNPDDYVARELSAALASKARVIPVLVAGASMPRTDNLPPPLIPLARRNAIEISDTRFTSDAERLVAAISRVLDPDDLVESGTVHPSPRSAVTAKHANSGGAPFSGSLSTLKAVLWINYALGLIAYRVGMSRASETATDAEAGVYLIIGIILFIFVAWMNIMLIRGKNWLRIAYLALTALTLPAMFLEDIKAQAGAEIALNIVGLFFSIWALRIMFTDPIKRNFEQN